MKPVLFLGSFLFGMVLQHGDTKPALTLRDVIEISADYEIHHPLVPMRSQWLGWTDPNEQKIFVIRNADLEQRRKTQIHEFLHVKRKFHHEVLANQEEEEIAVHVLAESLYKELFVQ